MRTGGLQAVGQLDVVGLVKACPQLDHHGDFLAGLGRPHQGIHHGRVRAGAIQRLLDGQYVGVFTGAPDELDDRQKRVERMM